MRARLRSSSFGVVSP